MMYTRSSISDGSSSAWATRHVDGVAAPIPRTSGRPDGPEAIFSLIDWAAG